MKKDKIKTIWSHYIFGSHLSTFCPHCFSEIEKYEFDKRIVNGFRVPPRKNYRVRIMNSTGLGKSTFVKRSNGLTVCYEVNVSTGVVKRAVSVCSHLDQFNKKLGRNICSTRISSGDCIELSIGDADKVSRKSLDEMFSHLAPIEIW